jgi:hypothetical protein
MKSLLSREEGHYIGSETTVVRDADRNNYILRKPTAYYKFNATAEYCTQVR